MELLISIQEQVIIKMPMIAGYCQILPEIAGRREVGGWSSSITLLQLINILQQMPVISSNARQSSAISGNLQQSSTISSNPRQSPAISGNLRQSLAISGNLRQSSAISGNLQQSPAISGNLHSCHAVRRSCSDLS